MMRFLVIVLGALSLSAQSDVPFRQEYPVAAGEVIRGADSRLVFPGHSGVVYTWGDRVLVWEMPAGNVRVLADGAGGYGPGGCLAEIDGDSRPDLILLERSAGESETGNLIWLNGASGQRVVIDNSAFFSDCVSATLHGRRGILLVHWHSQIRFYETPADPDGEWKYREIYSIYTPSDQGGLLVWDVDGDGLEDIVCGNYWVRAPGIPEQPWRLFAINLWHEQQRSAMASMARLPVATSEGSLVAAQGHMREARLAWYEPSSDRMKLWIEHRLEGMLRLRFPRLLTPGDFDGDGTGDLMVGENNGSGSRLFLFSKKDRGLSPRIIDGTNGLIRGWTADFNDDGIPDLVAAGPSSVSWWPSHLLR